MSLISWDRIKPGLHNSGRKDPSGVYFIRQRERNVMKVGFATNIRLRLRELQVSSPQELELIFYLDLAGTGLKRSYAERVVHAILKEKGRHIRGEWFLIKPEEVFEVGDLFWEAVGEKIPQPIDGESGKA